MLPGGSPARIMDGGANPSRAGTVTAVRCLREGAIQICLYGHRRRADRFGLDGVKLGLVDDPGVEQLLGPLDLARRATTAGGLAYVVVELGLRRGRLLAASLRHSVVLEDQIGQHADPRHDAN